MADMTGQPNFPAMAKPDSKACEINSAEVTATGPIRPAAYRRVLSGFENIAF
jgi:hypothetical protein